jgi:DNA-binding transcriptional LysR family regulator
MKKSAPIDLRSVRYLVAIVEEGTFARAAVKLGITQPALSRSVQALEHAVGAKLLDRGKSGATPTVFGRLLIERGRRLISDADAILREIMLLGGGETGEIAVGTGAYPAEISVAAAAGRLLAQRPGLKLRVSVGDWPDLTESVLAEKLDLAICDVAAAETNPRLHTEQLPEHRGLLFCRSGHPLAARKSLTLDDVREFPFALTAVPDRIATMLQHGTTLGRNVTAPAVHVDTFQLARDIVLQSDTVGVAIESQIADEVRDGLAVVLPIDLPWLVTRYGFIYLAGRTLAPTLRMFMDSVRAVESELGSRVPSKRKRRSID